MNNTKKRKCVLRRQKKKKNKKTQQVKTDKKKGFLGFGGWDLGWAYKKGKWRVQITRLNKKQDIACKGRRHL